MKKFLLTFLFLYNCLPSYTQDIPVRIMAANTTSGNFQSYLAPGERIFQGLAPDIVLINEFKIGSPASDSTSITNAWVEETFGSEFQWHRESGGEQIPNGIISRWPIIQSGQWTDPEVSNRDFAWARIDLPGDKDLWAVSVHFLTSNATDRRNEAQALLAGISSQNIPATDYIIIGGDFNTRSRTESAINELASIVDTSGPYPIDNNGDGDTNANRNEPYDWVLASPNFDTLETPLTIAGNTFTNGLVFDSRIYTPLSAVSPVQQTDSDASMMQHMAVLRDFILPDTTAGYSLNANSINFGQQNADNAPFSNNTVSITPDSILSISDVTLSGPGAAEFKLLSPQFSGQPITITQQTALVFQWQPTGNDGATRNITATFTTNAQPAAFQISISAQPLLTEQWFRELLLGKRPFPELIDGADLNNNDKLTIKDLLKFLN